MMEFPYPILEDLRRVLMIGGVGVEYPGEGVGPPPLMPNILLPWVTRSGMVLEPPVPPSRVEWMWMTPPPTGKLEVPALVFGPPLVVALASAVALALVVVLAPAVYAV
jgi:hypothetical protein